MTATLIKFPEPIRQVSTPAAIRTRGNVNTSASSSMAGRASRSGHQSAARIVIFFDCVFPAETIEAALSRIIRYNRATGRKTWKVDGCLLMRSRRISA